MNITETIQKKFPEALVSSHADFGDETLVIKKESLLSVMAFLKKDSSMNFSMLLDICGVDHLGQAPRFEVVYHLYALETRTRLRVKVWLDDSSCELESVMGIWEAADWFEREAYDMLGIVFCHHPKLKRLLMWEGFEGHPLRKDYPLNKRQPIPEPTDII